MTIRLALGDELDLPDSAVTSSFALLAMKGAGKSNAAVVFAEQLFAAGIPWVCIDPKGDWWGIRSGAGGNRGGLAVPIFGGLHADVPIDPHAGALFADLIVDQHLTCLIDVSELTKGESIRFLTAFFDRLYRRKNKHTFPMHLFLEECDDYVPQKVYRELAQLVRTVELVVKRGRQRGLGITLASQRAASVNKDVLTQTDTLIVLRTTSPQDRKAVLAWIDYNAAARDIVGDLPTLHDGEAWVSSPAALRMLTKVRFRRRHTFDSGATPELGETVRAATLADIDIEAITAKVGDLVEQAKADDPKTLRAELARLRHELDQAQRARVAEPEQIEVEVVHEVFPADLADTLETVVRDAGPAVLDGLVDELRSALTQIAAGIPTIPTHVTSAPKPLATKSHPTAGTAPARRATPTTGNAASKVLTAIVQYPGSTQKRIAALAGISAKSSTLRGALANLRAQNLITGPGNDLHPSAAGTAVVGDVSLPTGPELVEHWRAELGNGAAREVFEVFIAAGRLLSNQEIAYHAKISQNSSTLRGALAKLRRLGILNGNELDTDFAAAIA